MSPQLDLVGRAAIITGASRGLGRAIAETFVAAGAGVLLVAREAGPLREAEAAVRTHAADPRQRIEALVGDVAQPERCAAIVRHAEACFPDLAVLVNNAGVYGPMGRIEDVDWDTWVHTIHVNLLGTAAMCRAIVPVLRRRGYGKVINLSGGGATGPLPGISAYAASKAAVVRFTETLAEELRGTCIDVNAIAPGALNTRLLDEVLAAGPERLGVEFHRRALRQRDEGGVPLDKGAALARFLASAASDGITGRLLSAVWDDWAALPARREALASGDIFTLRRIVPGDRGLDW